jgi:hypothetical protein
MATSDSLRVGDAEREAVAAELREHYAQGRLSMEDFTQRLDAAYAARTRGDLDKLISDLPHANPAGAPLPAPPPGSLRRHGHGAHFAPPGAGFGYGERPWGRFGRFTSLLAAVASLLIVFMIHLSFPWPGRLGLLLAIFAVLRGLLRWIFRGTRRHFRR